MTQKAQLTFLRRLFGVVLDEAGANPEFARKLQAVLPAGTINSDRAKPTAARFNTSAYHAVNILRGQGENVLRGKLHEVATRRDLQTVAIFSGLVLPGSVNTRTSRVDLIEAIISAAKAYDAQRRAAIALGQPLAAQATPVVPGRSPGSTHY